MNYFLLMVLCFSSVHAQVVYNGLLDAALVTAWTGFGATLACSCKNAIEIDRLESTMHQQYHQICDDINSWPGKTNMLAALKEKYGPFSEKQEEIINEILNGAYRVDPEEGVKLMVDVIQGADSENRKFLKNIACIKRANDDLRRVGMRSFVAGCVLSIIKVAQYAHGWLDDGVGMER